MHLFSSSHTLLFYSPVSILFYCILISSNLIYSFLTTSHTLNLSYLMASRLFSYSIFTSSHTLLILSLYSFHNLLYHTLSLSHLILFSSHPHFHPFSLSFLIFFSILSLYSIYPSLSSHIFTFHILFSSFLTLYFSILIFLRFAILFSLRTKTV